MARKQYGHKKNLSFISGAVPPIPLESASKDLLTAFQFIEHIKDQTGFIKDAYRVLKPGGTFLCTTPNAKMSIARNPFHVHEMDFAEMKLAAEAVFDEVELWGVQGTERVNTYYEENAKWAKKILRFEPLGLHKLIPASLLVVPYNFLTSIMRKNLKSTVQETTSIETSDFFLTQENLDYTWDIVLIGKKH